MIRFTCPVYPSIRVHRGDNTYIEFHDGETLVNWSDAAILRGLDNVIEGDVARDSKGRPLQSYPLAHDVVSWYSMVLGVGDGFGNSAERMIVALEKRGVKIIVDPAIPTVGETFISNVRNRRFEQGKVRIAYSPPGYNFLPKYKGQVSLGFCMWEDSLLPPPWNQYLGAVDTLVAPSKFCVELLRERCEELGYDTPVSLVPLGVQTDFYTYQRRSRHPTQVFTILHSCTSLWDGRKGVDDAVAAFRAAFTDGENVKLVIRARIGQVQTFGDERIDVRISMLTEQQKLDGLFEAHCLLYPSYGEGFGLVPLEAIATGLPVICSENTGMLDYIDLVTIPIECDPEPSKIVIAGYETKGTWQRPRQEELVSALRDMYARYRTHVAKAAHAAKAVRAWSYDATASALLAAIEVAKERHRQVNDVPGLNGQAAGELLTTSGPQS